jgi:branched-chain amino acid aminotransferase
MSTNNGSVKDVNTLRIAPEVWRDGEFIAWNDARVHVMTHAIHYGSSVFEGIRAYATERGTAIFRLTEHLERLNNSAKIYRMPTRWTTEELRAAAIELVRRSGLEQCYLRPVMFRGLDEAKPSFGVNPLKNPMQCFIGAWDWGKYLGEEAIEAGVDVCVSSWTRITSNTLPPMAKAGANYMNSQLIKMEAILNGYSEGIALDDRGYISEGSGENLFAVVNGKLLTPPLASSVLPGITRDSVIEIAREFGIEVIESQMQRAALYLADELFFTGTAAEITPIRSVDKITVGNGKRGELTRLLQEAFFAVTDGTRPAPNGANWLTYVNEEAKSANAAIHHGSIETV